MRTHHTDVKAEFLPRKSWLALVCIGLLFLAPCAEAAPYYVSPTGLDTNAGNEAAPFKTIQKAANTAVAGDTVYVKQGTYSERIIPVNSGTAGNWITYQADPGHTVILDGNGVSMGWNNVGMIQIDDRSYIKISGFRINDSKGDGILIEYSDHITVEYNYIYHSCSRAVVTNYCNNIIIDGNESNLGHSWVGPSWPNGYSGTGEEISICATDVFEVKNNHIHHGYKEAIDVQTSSSNGSVHNNYIHHQGNSSGRVYGSAVYVDGGYYLHYGYPGTPIININIYQNRAHDIWGAAFVVGIESGAGWLENIVFCNNIAYNNVTGILFLEESGTMERNIWFINNTLVNNIFGFQSFSPQPENCIVMNNILSGNTGYQIRNSKDGKVGNFTAYNNLVNGPTQVYGTSYVTGDARLADSAAGNLRILSDSPARDRGSSQHAPSVDFYGNSRPHGAGVDIGAHEFSDERLGCVTVRYEGTPSTTP